MDKNMLNAKLKEQLETYKELFHSFDDTMLVDSVESVINATDEEVALENISDLEFDVVDLREFGYKLCKVAEEIDDLCCTYVKSN